MAKELIANDFDVDVATAMPNYPTGKIFEAYRGRVTTKETIDGVNIRRIWIPAAQGRGRARVSSLLGFAGLSVIPLARSRRPDLVFVNSAPLTFAPVALAFAKLWQVPAVLGISDLWPDSLVSAGVLGHGPALEIMRRLERSMYRHFDALSPVTDGMIEILLREKSVDAGKLAPIFNGVDCELFRPGDHQPTAQKTFAYCGTIGYLHGTEVVLDAMDLLRENRPDISVLFIGGGSERGRMERRARELGLDRVTFRDPIPPSQLADLLQTVTAGLVTLKDIEANQHARSAKTLPLMAAGLPVVLSGAGETASIVADANCGLVVEPGDAAVLAAAMETVADSPERSREWGRNGRHYAVENLSWTSNVAGWLDALRRQSLLPERVIPHRPLRRV